MAKGAKVFVDTTGIRRAVQRLDRFSTKRMEQIRQRSIGTVRRRLRAEAAREISEHQLNLSPRQISPYINVKAGKAGGMDYVAVTASDQRLPLRLFKARYSKKSGVTVQTWRDAPPVRLPHAFKRGNEFWQRIPAGPGQERGPSGLVHRLPIVQRKGPSLKRTLQPTRHGGAHKLQTVVDNLSRFARDCLADEIQRHLAMKD
jgi:hypothetical protein